MCLFQKKISISTSTYNPQEVKKRKRYSEDIATSYHKRERKLESIRKSEEIKEHKKLRESLKAEVALKI